METNKLGTKNQKPKNQKPKDRKQQILTGGEQNWKPQRFFKPKIQREDETWIQSEKNYKRKCLVNNSLRLIIQYAKFP